MICKLCHIAIDDNIDGLCSSCRSSLYTHTNEDCYKDTRVTTTYHERLITFIRSLGETLIENAESIVPDDTTLLSGLTIWSDLSHNDSIPNFDVNLKYCIKNSDDILKTRSNNHQY